MRSIIVDFARGRLRERRGGSAAHETLDTELLESLPTGDEQIVEVHGALEGLARRDPRLVQVVEMRYFVGLSEQERPGRRWPVRSSSWATHSRLGRQPPGPQPTGRVWTRPRPPQRGLTCSNRKPPSSSVTRGRGDTAPACIVEFAGAAATA